jgi:hypothetical protein
MKKLKTQPADWPANAPAYHSPEGWAFEKILAYNRLLKELNIKK